MGKIYRNGKTITSTNYIERNVNEAKKYMTEVQVPDEFASKTSQLKSFMSSDKKLWLLGCGGKHNIYKFNEATNSFDLFFNDDSFTSSLTGIWEYSDNIIFFTFSSSTILVKYDRQTNEFVNITVQSFVTSTPKTSSMLFMDYGLFINCDNRVQFIDFETNTSVDSGWIYNPIVTTLNNDTSTDIFVTTSNNAILKRFDKNTKQWVKDWQGSSGYINIVNSFVIFDTLGHRAEKKFTTNNYALIKQRANSSFTYWLYHYSDTPEMTELEDFSVLSATDFYIYETAQENKYIFATKEKQPKIYLWDMVANTLTNIGQFATEYTSTNFPRVYEYNGKYIVWSYTTTETFAIDTATFERTDIAIPQAGSSVDFRYAYAPIIAHNGDFLLSICSNITYKLNLTTNSMEYLMGTETTTMRNDSGYVIRFIYNDKTYLGVDYDSVSSTGTHGLYEYDGTTMTYICSGGVHELVIYEGHAFAVDKVQRKNLYSPNGYVVSLEDTTKTWSKVLINCNNKYYLASTRQFDVCLELNLDDLSTQVSNDTGITACLLSRKPTICLNSTCPNDSSGGKVVFSNQNAQAVSIRIYDNIEKLFTDKIPVFVKSNSYGNYYLWFKGEFA